MLRWHILATRTKTADSTSASAVGLFFVYSCSIIFAIRLAFFLCSFLPRDHDRFHTAAHSYEFFKCTFIFSMSFLSGFIILKIAGIFGLFTNTVIQPKSSNNRKTASFGQTRFIWVYCKLVLLFCSRSNPGIARNRSNSP